MIDVLKGLCVALTGTVVLCLIIVFVSGTIKTVTERGTKSDDHNDLKLTHPYEYADLEQDIREQIAQEFDRMGSQLNPDDRERSALYSQWAMNAADRIRYPERYSGTAQGGGDVLHAVSADGTRIPLGESGSSSSD